MRLKINFVQNYNVHAIQFLLNVGFRKQIYVDTHKIKSFMIIHH